jgi:replication-associated recombination protein RarA
MITPVEFKPKTIDDFCGPARKVAELLQKMIGQRAPQGIPMRVLLKGEAGTGKSSLAQWFVNQIAPDPFAVKFFNGTEVTMERVSELIADLSYRPMGGGYRCVWIDEADGIPTTAHKRFLSYMDRLKNTKYSAIVITSNESLEQFEERFQTRFQPFEVEGPTFEELKAFLQRFTSDAGKIDQVARCACGVSGGAVKTVQFKTARANVRQALDDLDTALLVA